MDTKQWLSRWVKPTTAATTQRKHEKSSGAQVSHTDPIRGLPVVPNTHYVTRKVFSFMVWHLNDSVKSLWRLELKPEWSPFKAHADLDHFKLTTSCQGTEQTQGHSQPSSQNSQGAFTAMLTIPIFVLKRDSPSNDETWVLSRQTISLTIKVN